MGRKKRQRGGRVTPKGTQNPGSTKHEHHDHDEWDASPMPRELQSKLHEQRGAPPRPISHNQGNR